MDVSATLDAPRKPAPEFEIGQRIACCDGASADDRIVTDIQWRDGRWVYTFAPAPADQAAAAIESGLAAARIYGGRQLYLPSGKAGRDVPA